ncbi:MAG: hypothetical protein AAF573_18665 [Bacteroidota bacterium]
MMNLKSLLLAASLVALFATCKEVDKKLLIGTWKGAEMMENGKAVDKGIESAEFQFLDNKTYTYQIASHKEGGPYHIFEDQLITTDTINDGRIEKKVRIKKLTSDSLYLEMNLGGMPQLMKCYRAK